MLELNIRTFGDAGRPPIILLHGLFGSSANWGGVARHLSRNHQVLVPDLRNHGLSPHYWDVGYPAMVADVLRLMDGQGIASATLVGHSMGGKVAMHLALNNPQRVTGLAVVDISPVRYAHDFNDVLQGFRAVDLDTIRNRAEADAQMTASVDIAGVRAFLLQNLVKRADGWGWRLNLDALAASQADILDFPAQAAGVVYRGPVSFIHGVLSDYVMPEYEPRILGFFPAADLCPVAQAGHWVYAEQPQGFLTCLDSFLTRSVTAGS